MTNIVMTISLIIELIKSKKVLYNTNNIYIKIFYTNFSNTFLSYCIYKANN